MRQGGYPPCYSALMDATQAAEELLKRRKARSHIREYAHYLNYQGFQPAHHQDFLLDNLNDVFEGVVDRLMVFEPPGMAKSTYCSVIAPSFYMGKYPDERVISASNDTDLATEFGGKVRNIVLSNERHAVLFPGMNVSKDTKAKGQWNIDGANGGYYATGVGAAIVGRRANLAILDDIVKGRDEADSSRIMEKTWEWLFADLMTRLLPNGKIILIMTRWSQNDPAGRLLPEDWNGESGDIKCNDGRIWRVVCLPAQAQLNDPLGRQPGEYMWTDFYSNDWWEAKKKEQNQLGTRNWGSLYQQNPTPEEGTFFKREWFKWYDETPKHLTHYMAADFAVTENAGDFTEIGVFGVDTDDDLYVAPEMGWYSGQINPFTWIEHLLDLGDHFKPQVCLSEVGTIRRAMEGSIAKRMQERKIYFMMEWMSNQGGKAANARAFQARAQQGKVYLPNNDVGRRILVQLLEFPAGKYDDVVDVCGMMGRYLQMTTKPYIDKPKIIVRDRWDKAFERDDNTENRWRIA